MSTRQRPGQNGWSPAGLGAAGLLAVLAIVATAQNGRAGADPAGVDAGTRSARERFFEQSVRPLLVERCYSCHAGAKHKGGLRLDSIEAILHGGDSGPAVVPGKPTDSLLIEAVNYQGLEMPPTGKLEPTQIDALARWVALGAPWPSHDRASAHAAPADNADKAALAGGGVHAPKPLWSFQPIRRPALPPPVTGSDWDPADWTSNPIDRFVSQKLAEKALSPAPPADRMTLIRRVTFDLTGLPPTPDEVDAFLADDREDAYERLVDRLLASPRYGQRWARHWLDLVRYADSDGYRQDAYRQEIWRYRDYVVRSFNADKPFDRFIAEQLAGDELDADDPELRVATGYLRLGPYEYNQRDVPGQWADILNDITDVTGEVFLGLSIGCARCHDHKFDPILQEDYYRLRAFFAPLLPRDDLPLARAREQDEYRARRLAWEKAAAGVLAELDRIAQPYRDRGTRSALAKFPDEIRAILAKPESQRTPLERQIGALAYRQVAFEHAQVPNVLKGADKTRWKTLQDELKRFDGIRPHDLESVMAATDVGPVAPPTVIPGDRRARAIEPGYPVAIDSTPASIQPPAAAPKSTGRRLALARWLARPDNPLTSRVAVNRIWQAHFGRGLVSTSSDFGRLGEPPSHPDLLDWLASEFVRDGWRSKPIHRLIVTSSTYRQAAHRRPDDVLRAARIDPENRLLWKQTVRRLDAEEIRDAMLAASGELDSRMGGPGEDAKGTRRSLDTRIMRNAPDPFLTAFDAPDGSGTTGQRVTTTTSTQALLLLNGRWTLARAGTLAGRVELASAGSTSAHGQVLLAYRLCLARLPGPDELSQVMDYLEPPLVAKKPTRLGQLDRRARLADFCHVLLNCNEFLYVD
ncbi:MAG: PSD1 and planctomycete cytochrome C domain-containing protein [Isosphaeraceae bacterium]